MRKFGRYLLLDEHHLDLTERFFARYGDKTIFVSRFVPVVRHLISIPAGVGRMSILKFTVYTLLGAALWNAILTIAGYHLRNNWQVVRKYGSVADIIVVLAGIIVIGYAAYHYRRRMKKKQMIDS